MCPDSWGLGWGDGGLCSCPRTGLRLPAKARELLGKWGSASRRQAQSHRLGEKRMDTIYGWHLRTVFRRPDLCHTHAILSHKQVHSKRPSHPRASV